MKKVMIGVGIGCGVLVLIGVVGMFAAGMWLKGKVETAAGDLAETGEVFKEQERQVSALDAKFPFTAPAEGTFVAIDEARLEAWLRVGEAGRTKYAEFEQEQAALKDKFKKAEGAESVFQALGRASEGMGFATRVLAETRAHMLTALERERMSPTEFKTITVSVLGSSTQQMLLAAGAAMDAQESSFGAQRAELQARLESEDLDDAEREGIQGLLEALEDSEGQMKEVAQQMAAKRPTEAQARIIAANAALVEKHKDRLEKVGGAVLLAVLFNDRDDGSSGE